MFQRLQKDSWKDKGSWKGKLNSILSFSLGSWKGKRMENE